MFNSRFFRISIFHFRALNALFSIQTAILLAIISPLFEFTFFILMAKFFTGTNDLTFWCIGNSIVIIKTTTLFSIAGYFMTERFNGTLKYLFFSPVNKFTFLVSISVIPMILAFIQVSCGLVVGIVFFKMQINLSIMPLYFLNLLIVIFSSLMFGITISSLGMVLPQMHVALNIAYSFIMIFSGANYPLSVIPPVLRWISYILPMSRGIQSARNILADQFSPRLMIEELIVGICYLLIGVFMLKITQHLAKKLGTLELY